MKEIRGNLWAYPADVRVITTNGTVKKNGECVMGRGCALEAKNKFKDIAVLLGDWIQHKGNVPVRFKFSTYDFDLCTFPVKHNWYEKADINLITKSAETLMYMHSHPKYQDTIIVLPRPGCGNGGLRWEDVKPILEPILDDRFHVITF
jgi:hypothetical protein